MSLEDPLQHRWSNVIEPAVTECKLDAYRVDAAKISDSILTDIVTGISDSKLVLADISLVGAARNGNAMYEVGLAHAVRLPQEVLLFRSDNAPLLFDIANVRVNAYDPDLDPDNAKEVVRSAIIDALREVDLQRSLTVQRIANAIDGVGLDLLDAAAQPEGLAYPPLNTVQEVLANGAAVQAIPRLIDLGLIQPRYGKGTVPPTAGVRDYARDRVSYRLTTLGEEVLAEVLQRLLQAAQP